MRLTVNDEPIEIASLPGEMLSDLLRDRLRLTGTKIGCSEDECGACTVLLDGDPVFSCTYPSAKAAGKAIITIEGLARAPINFKNQTLSFQSLHPLQQAFIKHGAVQCGFCIPGQIMTAYALLSKNLEPTEEDIRHELKDTLCRCAGYGSIIQAIQASAESMRLEKPVAEPVIPLSSEPLSVVGKVIPRPDALAKVTGRAVFTDDLIFENMLHARVKRAEIPHAIVKQIDVQNAKKIPGVEAVLTAADLRAERHHGLVVYDWPVLVGVGERVRYVGDAVALVAAKSRPVATQALELIEVEYDPMPVISDPIQANQPGSPQIHSKGNLLKHIKVRKGSVKQGFSESDVTLEHTFQTAITEHAFLEPECSIARPLPDGRMEIYVGSQIPYADREQVANVLGVEADHVRVIGQLMGGGFGGKEDIAGQVHAALLAQATGLPVKLLFDRQESFKVHPKRHATNIRVRIGAKNDGSLVAVETVLFGDTGAYASLGEKVLTRATTHSSGPYEIPHARADCYAMYTNNPPAGAFRGFGVTQSAFAIESAIDMLAGQLRLDPVDIRRKNALKVGSVTNTGQKLRNSVGLLDCLDRTAEKMKELAGDEPFASRKVPGAPHRRRAWGLAIAYKNTGLGDGAPDKAGAEVELYSDGTIEVRTSSAELGQGLVTVLEMIVAEEFGLPVSKVRALVMDTGLTPDGGPTTASRQTYVTGNAALHAARYLRQAVAATLAEKFDQPPNEIRFLEGLAKVGEKIFPLGDVVAIMRAEGREPRALFEYWAPETQPIGQAGDMHFAFSFAAQAAEVEVDIRTGEVRVLRVIAATDVGKVINPLGLQGQVEGGVVMGIGNALTEEFIVEQGYLFTDRMARYRIPSIMQYPEIISIPVEHPTAEGPYGAKGVGEIISIPTTPAITNAIYNAVGVRIDRLPVDQEEIFKQYHGFYHNQ